MGLGGLGASGRILGRLGASWGRLGASWGVLGRLGRVLEAYWRRFGLQKEPGLAIEREARIFIKWAHCVSICYVFRTGELQKYWRVERVWRT